MEQKKVSVRKQTLTPEQKEVQRRMNDGSYMNNIVGGVIPNLMNSDCGKPITEIVTKKQYTKPVR